MRSGTCWQADDWEMKGVMWHRHNVSERQWGEQAFILPSQIKELSLDLGAGWCWSAAFGLWSREHWDPASQQLHSRGSSPKRAWRAVRLNWVVRPALWSLWMTGKCRGLQNLELTSHCLHQELCLGSLLSAPMSSAHYQPESSQETLGDSPWTGSLSPLGHHELKRRWVDPRQLEESWWGLEGVEAFSFGFGEAELNEHRHSQVKDWLMTSHQKQREEPQFWECLEKPEIATDCFFKSLGYLLNSLAFRTWKSGISETMTKDEKSHDCIAVTQDLSPISCCKFVIVQTSLEHL